MVAFAAFAVSPVLRGDEDLGAMWGSAEEEAKYYPIVNVPIPPGVPMHPGGFEILPDGRLAVGTRRGDIYFVKGAFDSPPNPEFHLFASAARYRLGQMNDDGKSQDFGENARARLRDCGVTKVDAMVNVLAPGAWR